MARLWPDSADQPATCARTARLLGNAGSEGEAAMTDDLSTPEGRRAFGTRSRAALQQRMKDYKPTDKVDALCHDASMKAAQWANDDGLYPEFTEWNEPRYTIQQGLRAAHVGREDSAAILILTRPILRYLRDVSALLWVIIALLVIILWRIW